MEDPVDVVLIDDCFRISGELFGDRAVEVSQTLRQLAAATGGDSFRLDLSGVTFCDSCGLREILLWSRSQPAMRIIAVNQKLERKMTLAGMTEILLRSDAWRPSPLEQ